MTKGKVIKKHIQAMLLWFDEAYDDLDPFGRGTKGRGIGELIDRKGVRYIVFGFQLGGHLSGENPDPDFIKVEGIYMIHSVWVRPDSPTIDVDDFFLGYPFRVKTIQTISGRSPIRVAERLIQEAMEMQKKA